MTGKRVGIVGAGPGGLATARVLLEDFIGVNVTIFDSNPEIGGVWFYPEDDKSGRVMYDYLETNISKDLMQFSGFPFKAGVPFYPNRGQVWEYLQEYYTQFIKSNAQIDVKLSTSVVRVSKHQDGRKWIITTGEGTTEKCYDFDYVVISNGHFTTPKIPSGVKGLDEWFQQGRALHSKDFHNCEFARDKTIIVVGNGSSGSDIANQCSTVASKVYVSVTNLDEVENKQGSLIEYVPKIRAVQPNGTVLFENGDQLEDVDHLVYATGYLYTLPFFDSEFNKRLVKKDGSGINGLWNHVIYKADPTLAFTLLPQMVVPFPLAESQAAVISQVFQHNITIDKDEREDRDETHNFPDLSDVEYYRTLQSVLDKTPHRFQPVVWDDAHRERRAQSAQEKKVRNGLLAKHAQQLHENRKPYYLPRL
ncbi:N,N-dimethylaniline monooxygenase [Nakaseomyces bracarensis]|uniref:N,N-dimethylaniline monooxygenase n=1 Tax=Nakaseomyces bracarensis TaxID=273131 RepID=UPI003871F6CD